MSNIFSNPHPIFAIVLVGQEEVPFGIQKDLLCAKSTYFKQLLQGPEQSLEQLIKIPDTDPTIFGCFQNFIFTGTVYDKRGGVEIPSYPILMGIWRLATKLAMAPLRIAVLETMTERREQTGTIPGAPLLEQAWKETEEGSGLRKMLINWAAEHMRANPPSRNEFVHGLPKDILTELVLTMGDMASNDPVSPRKHRASFNNPVDVDFESLKPAAKRRKSEAVVKANPLDEAYEIKPPAKKVARKSEPIRRPAARRSTATPSDIPVSPEQDLEDCRLLINRMMTAPSYWTRYVKYFREPVDPVRDNLVGYLTVVKRPMDLKTIQTKMSNNEYATAEDFLVDVRQIFQNVYEYWQREDVVFKECETFQKFFERQYENRHQKSAGSSRVKAEVIED